MTLDDPTRRRAHRAVVVAFLAHGVVSGSWFVRIPDLRDLAGLSDGGLGLVLAALGIGAVVSMPLAGALATRHGSAPAMRWLLPPLLAVLALAAQASAPLTLALGSLAFGAALGAHDIAINAHGVAVEHERGRPVLSGMHAAFSIGTLLGAGVGALAMAADVAPRVHLLAIAAVTALALLAYRHLLPAAVDRHRTAVRAVPPTLGERLAPLRRRWLLACAIAAMASFIAENAVGEWSGVLLRDHRDASPALAAIGFLAFSLAMTVGRLTGDRMVAALGDRRTLLLGGALAGTAWALVALVDDAGVAIAAWVVAGLALANAVPIVFRAAGARRPVGPDGRPAPVPAQALAAVSGLGYAGGLLGPSLIGAVAELLDLPTAMLIPALLAASIALLARSATGGERLPSTAARSRPAANASPTPTA
ncbi:major facilitator superfamily MFS_1 [Patulibacter medicamentivorans]|uniref:Major facilitator superfamily MFS_1 n=1 Tax=Patulibacter medicamentivorans TaxID=1097667 RepID=H0E7W4_9ACTN|nr:MFS transporter [Patulibacter medicamentivorans]EHN10231.1 major facilitator superfamily MFS_1 [Patulibacter medicamentivorans]